MKKQIFSLILIQFILWPAFAGNGSGRGGGGGIACFADKKIKDASFSSVNGQLLLKREAIDQIRTLTMLDLVTFAKTKTTDINLLPFAEPKNLIEKKKNADVYLTAIDNGLKNRFSPYHRRVLMAARAVLKFEDWIDNKGSIEIFQDYKVLPDFKSKEFENCGYVQLAIRSKVTNGWQVVYDKELVEKKLDSKNLAILIAHEEVYLFSAFLKDFQVNWDHLDSYKVRQFVSFLFSETFHQKEQISDPVVLFSKMLKESQLAEATIDFIVQLNKKDNKDCSISTLEACLLNQIQLFLELNRDYLQAGPGIWLQQVVLDRLHEINPEMAFAYVMIFLHDIKIDDRPQVLKVWEAVPARPSFPREIILDRLTDGVDDNEDKPAAQAICQFSQGLLDKDLTCDFGHPQWKTLPTHLQKPFCENYKALFSKVLSFCQQASRQ